MGYIWIWVVRATARKNFLYISLKSEYWQGFGQKTTILTKSYNLPVQLIIFAEKASFPVIFGWLDLKSWNSGSLWPVLFNYEILGSNIKFAITNHIPKSWPKLQFITKTVLLLYWCLLLATEANWVWLMGTSCLANGEMGKWGIS